MYVGTTSKTVGQFWAGSTADKSRFCSKLNLQQKSYMRSTFAICRIFTNQRWPSNNDWLRKPRIKPKPAVQSFDDAQSRQTDRHRPTVLSLLCVPSSIIVNYIHQRKRDECGVTLWKNSESEKQKRKENNVIKTWTQMMRVFDIKFSSKASKSKKKEEREKKEFQRAWRSSVRWVLFFLSLLLLNDKLKSELPRHDLIWSVITCMTIA